MGWTLSFYVDYIGADGFSNENKLYGRGLFWQVHFQKSRLDLELWRARLKHGLKTESNVQEGSCLQLTLSVTPGSVTEISILEDLPVYNFKLIPH